MGMINKIIHGDCLDVMKRIPDGVIDLVITSPPYKAGKEYETWKSLDEYKKFAREWTQQISRVVSNTGSFWLNVGYTKTGENSTLPLTYLYYQLVDMKLIQEIVWHYEGGMSYKKRFTHRTERWMWFSKSPSKVTFNLDKVRDSKLNRTVDKRNNPLGKNPTDYWYFNRVTSGIGKSKEKTSHPCQFPEAMIVRIILACSNSENIILDPFIGSGTTAIACIRTKRRFVGIEKDKHYWEIANQRIEAEYNGANLAGNK